MEVINLIVTIVILPLLAIVGYFIQKNITTVEDSLKHVGMSLFEVSKQVTTVVNDIMHIKNEIDATHKVSSKIQAKIDTLQQKLNDVKVDMANLGVSKVNDTFGKVIVIEDQIKRHEKALKLAGSILDKLNKSSG